MQELPPTLESVFEKAVKLPTVEKLGLIKRLAEHLEGEVGRSVQSTPRRLRSLRGILKGSALGDVDIDEARKEMWGTFPREDI